MDYCTGFVRFLFCASNPVFHYRQLSGSRNTGSGIPVSDHRTGKFFDPDSKRNNLCHEWNLYRENSSIGNILGFGNPVPYTHTLISLNFWNQLNTPQVRIITIGLLCSGICYIVSCISQYGLLFSGPAGISLPFGVILLIIYAILLRFYGPFLFDIDEDVSKTDQISY